MPGAYTVTLNHVRYGRFKFDLAELRRRLEAAIAGGRDASALAHLLVHTSRLMTLMDALERRGNDRALRKTLDAEFALLLLDFEQVQAVMSGGGEKPKRARKQRALAPPRRKLTRQPPP